MKKLLTIIALTAVVAGLPAGSFAADKKSKATPAPATPAATPTPPKQITMYAQVTTIDTAGRTFTHKKYDGTEEKFVLTDKTVIKQGKSDAKFEDIKVGDWVSGLRLKKGDAEWEVIKITKFGPKTEKKGEATPKPGEKKTS